MIENLIAIIKKNWIIAAIVGIILALILFPRQVKRMFNPTRRKRRRLSYPAAVSRRSQRRRIRRRLPRSVGMLPRSGRRLPRSVGTKRVSSKGYPAAAGGYIPFKYNKDGSVKKAWQVGGTVAARNRMRGLRRKK